MQPKKTTEKLALEDELLDEVQGGLGETYKRVDGKDQACSRYFPAANPGVDRRCETCFYFHLLEDGGYCSR